MAFLTKSQIEAQVASLLASGKAGGILATDHRTTMQSIIDKAYTSNIDGVSFDANTGILTFTRDSGNETPILVDIGQAGIPDAPSDGQQYTRLDGTWDENSADKTSFDNTDAKLPDNPVEVQTAIDKLKVYVDELATGQGRYRGTISSLDNPTDLTAFAPITAGDIWVIGSGSEVQFNDTTITYLDNGNLYADVEMAGATDVNSTNFTFNKQEVRITQKVQPITGELLFDDIGGYVTGTPASPVNNAAFDIKPADAIDGVVNQIYYQGASLPNFTGAPVTNFTPNNFVANELCLLTIILSPVAGYVLYVTAPANPLIETKVVVDPAYTLVASDRNKVLEFTFNGAVTVTVPSGLVAGYNCAIVNNTGNVLTFQDDGTSTIIAEGLSLETDATAASILCYGANRLQIIGKLS